MKIALFFKIIILSIIPFIANSQEIEMEVIANGFDSPVEITNAGDSRLFVVERSGFIHVISSDGNVLPNPFLDIENDVVSCGGGCEIGLLGLAFHPNYAENGYFYVNYTMESGNDLNTIIARFTVSEDANIADENSQEILLEIDQPYSNHNGGCIRFGPDGYLYIGMGDGGAGGDPQSFGQNRQSLLAKMLRIDVDNGNPYTIPTDNPFATDDQTLDEIWAIGLRNPWRFSFDKENEDLWIADVGQNAYEEINHIPNGTDFGLNFGWRCKEGFETYINDANCPDDNALFDPIHVYPNNGTGTGCSVTGGFVYRGCQYPLLYGRYIYGDYCSGNIWSIIHDNNGNYENELLIDFNNFQLSTFGQDVNGELYVAGLGNGNIYKITETTMPLILTSEVNHPTCPGDNDGAINIDIPGDNDYVWSTGDTSQDLENLPEGEYFVTVTTENGCQIENSFSINDPNFPIPTIIVNENVLSVSNGFFNVAWYLGGDIVGNGNEYIVTTSGEYTVSYTSSNGCEVFSEESIMIVLDAIDAIPFLNSFYIFPNPFSESLVLKLETNQSEEIEIAILSIDGKVLIQNKTQLTIGEQMIKIPTSDLQNGIYLLQLKSQSDSISRKLLKL